MWTDAFLVAIRWSMKSTSKNSSAPKPRIFAWEVFFYFPMEITSSRSASYNLEGHVFNKQ